MAMSLIQKLGAAAGRPLARIAEVRPPAVADPAALHPGDAPPTDGRLLVLYDGACGICLHGRDLFARWDKGRALADDLIARHDAHLLGNMDTEETYGSLHVIHPDGRVESGGGALASLIGALRFGAPLGAILRRFPGLTEAAYTWFAGHRVGISQTTGLTNHPQRDPSQLPGSSRS